jgi:hypothetical protein
MLRMQHIIIFLISQTFEQRTHSLQEGLPILSVNDNCPRDVEINLIILLLLLLDYI